MKNHIGAYQAKTHLSEILDQVANGESFTITKHGVPVARLVPAVPVDSQPTKQVVEEMLSFKLEDKKSKKVKIAQMLKEGRRF